MDRSSWSNTTVGFSLKSSQVIYIFSRKSRTSEENLELMTQYFCSPKIQVDLCDFVVMSKFFIKATVIDVTEKHKFVSLRNVLLHTNEQLPPWKWRDLFHCQYSQSRRRNLHLIVRQWYSDYLCSPSLSVSDHQEAMVTRKGNPREKS